MLALLLACTGVWSVVAFAVARRRRGIGVRVALGAAPGAVVRTALRRGTLPALGGAGAGVAVASAVSRLLAGVLFGVQPTDPWALAGAASLLLVVAAPASWLPARGAAGVDPVVALRSE